MEPESILSVLKLTQPLATLEHARAVAEYAHERGLTPFSEFSVIFTERKQKINGKWQVVGIKGLNFKEHYSVQNRWAQQSGGYSVPYRETRRNVQRPTGYTDDDGEQKMQTGVEVEVGVITNRDYAALAQLAALHIPGWDFNQERKAFMHTGIGFCENSHKPPSGWTIEDVARKRAEEAALRRAFGKEPSQSRHLYTAALSIEARRDVVDALYGPTEPQPQALPAPAPVVNETEYEDGVVVEAPAPAPAEPEPQAQPVQEPELASEPTASMSMAEARGYFAAAFNAAKKSGKTPKPINMEGLSVTEIIRAADAL